jgi:hypothetical protein
MGKRSNPEPVTLPGAGPLTAAAGARLRRFPECEPCRGPADPAPSPMVAARETFVSVPL